MSAYPSFLCVAQNRTLCPFWLTSFGPQGVLRSSSAGQLGRSGQSGEPRLAAEPLLRMMVLVDPGTTAVCRWDWAYCKVRGKPPECLARRLTVGIGQRGPAGISTNNSQTILTAVSSWKA